jgi:hypothetical protein
VNLSIHESDPLPKSPPLKESTDAKPGSDWPMDRSLASSKEFAGLNHFTRNLGGSLQKDYLSNMAVHLTYDFLLSFYCVFCVCCVCVSYFLSFGVWLFSNLVETSQSL